MHKLEEVAERIRQEFDARTASRDQALAHARQLTRACSLAIRAVHRNDTDAMEERLLEARGLAGMLTDGLKEHPDLYFAGYTQDALKEFVVSIKGPLTTPVGGGIRSLNVAIRQVFCYIANINNFFTRQ